MLQGIGTVRCQHHQQQSRARVTEGPVCNVQATLDGVNKNTETLFHDCPPDRSALGKIRIMFSRIPQNSSRKLIYASPEHSLLPTLLGFGHHTDSLTFEYATDGHPPEKTAVRMSNYAAGDGKISEWLDQHPQNTRAGGSCVERACHRSW